jgi:hypothetical protein
VKIFLIINFQNPFKIEIASLLVRISYIAFAVWILAVVSNAYMDWLIENGIGISEVSLQKYMGGGSEFFFLVLIVYTISQIFKRGIELQSENELTI